jgi:exocyst complex protein 7
VNEENMHATRADTSERRFEIQCKLESEIAALEALKEAEERSRRLTSGVVGILSSLEERLATLRRTILPVYNETGNLQAQQHSMYLILFFKYLISRDYYLFHLL